MFRRLVLAVAFAACAAGPTFAQQNAAPLATTAFGISAAASPTLGVSSTSARQSLLSTVPTVWANNVGTVAACVVLGNSSVVAAYDSTKTKCPGGTIVGPNQTVTFGIAGNADLAAITLSGTTTLDLYEGYQQPIIVGSGGGGGGVVTTSPNGGATGILAVGGAAGSAALAVSAASLPLPTGAATAANQTSPQGTVGAGTAPTNMVVGGGIYNTSAPSPTNGQSVAFQLDSAGRLIVDCSSGCGGSGGTSLADEAGFTQGTTSLTPIGGFYNTSVTNLTAGQAGSVRLTAARLLMVNLTDLEAALGAGTAPSDMIVGGLVYNTSAPSPTNGQSVAFQGDSAGNLKVNVQASALPSNAAQETGGNLATIAGTVTSSVLQTNMKQVNGVATLTGAGATGTGAQRVTTAQDTTTIAGSAPGTAGTPSANVVTVQGTSAGTDIPISIDQTTQGTTNGVQLKTGSALAGAFNAYQGGSAVATGNALYVQPGTSALFSVNLTQVDGTALGAPSAYGTPPGAVNVVGVNANVTASALPTGAATSANQPTNASQASTTSGQTGHLVQGAVTTAAPSYTTGQTDPLSLDTVGNLRVNVTTSALPTGAASASNQTNVQGVVGNATAPADMVVGGAVYNSTPLTLTNGQSSALQADANGYLNVHIQAGAGSGGTAMTDEGTFTQGTTNFTPSGGYYNSSPVSLTSGQGGALRVTATRLLMANLPDIEAALGAGTAPSDMIVTGLQYNTSAPTPTNGQTVAAQGDSSGNLKTNVQASVPEGTTADSAYGGSGSASVISILKGIYAAATGAVPAGTNTIGKVDVLGNAGAAFDGATGSAAPSNATQAGAVSSGNLVGIVQADNSVAINISTATTTQLVALASGKKIYVTSYDVIAGGTGNITFEYGTGTNCGTGTTALTGAYNLTAQAGLAIGAGLGPVMIVPAGNALCALTSAAVQMSGRFAYTQF
jgi:hypothetical protein